MKVSNMTEFIAISYDTNKTNFTFKSLLERNLTSIFPFMRTSCSCRNYMEMIRICSNNSTEYQNCYGRDAGCIQTHGCSGASKVTISNDIIILMILSILPKFINSCSKESSIIRKLQNIINACISSPSLIFQPWNTYDVGNAPVGVESSFHDNNAHETNLSTIDKATVQYIQVEESFDNIFSTTNWTLIRRVLEYGSWLMVFMSAVENLPVCVSLSTARKDRYGFPLIYVNKHFETTSGYERSTILGLNCRFLQRDNTGVSNTEKESTDKISVSLRNAVPVRVALTNYRRDGTPFRNLLAIKPVFDTDGVYQYVVGVQFNLYSEQESAYTLRLADSIFDLLPGVVAR